MGAILKAVLPENEPFDLPKNRYRHVVGVAISHPLVTFQMCTSNTLAAIINVLSLKSTRMRFGQPLPSAGVDVMSKFQLSSFGRKEKNNKKKFKLLPGSSKFKLELVTVGWGRLAGGGGWGVGGQEGDVCGWSSRAGWVVVQR